MLRETTVPAGEIEDGVTGFERRPERDDQLRTMRQVRRGIRIRILRPTLRLCLILL